MPVNLATILDTADSINKTTGWKNWFYQFGRPTPLLCPGAYNSNSMPPVGNCIKSSAATNIEDGINKPSYFFQSSSSFYDNWFTYESEKTRNLWDTAGHYRSSNMLESKVVKSVYDPCPVGWKIPSINMLLDFTKNNSYTIGSFTNGWKFKRY